jgi:hypothetical protein
VPPDDPLGTPIAAQPGALDGRVALLLMESTLSDPDLCTGDDCDNLGRESQHRLRILLIPRSWPTPSAASSATPTPPASSTN